MYTCFMEAANLKSQNCPRIVAAGTVAVDQLKNSLIPVECYLTTVVSYLEDAVASWLAWTAFSFVVVLATYKRNTSH